MMLLYIVSIGALFMVLTNHSEGAKLAGIDSSLETKAVLETRGESLVGCSISSLSKCYGVLPPDGSTPSNLIEEIGQVSDAQKCQVLCKSLYHGTCNWFMFDRTTNDFMLFSGSLKDLQDDCREVGYAREPNHASCDTVFSSNSSDGCYNFREDYCRFDFSLLENLDDIDSLSECQLACEYVSNCSYFLYDNPTKTCKLYTDESSKRICDIIHGTPEPDFNTCIEEGYVPWASQAAVTTGQSIATNQPTEKASSTTLEPDTMTTSSPNATTAVSNIMTTSTPTTTTATMIASTTKPSTTSTPTTTTSTLPRTTTNAAGTSMFGCSNDKVALKSYYGKYVVAESDGNANANRLLRGESEIFTVEKLGDDYCALKSKYGKYLVAESNEQDVNANRSVAGPWETFTVLKQTDGTYAIKTAHGRYLVAKPDGRLKGNGTGVGNQEKFTAECITSA